MYYLIFDSNILSIPMKLHHLQMAQRSSDKDIKIVWMRIKKSDGYISIKGNVEVKGVDKNRNFNFFMETREYLLLRVFLIIVISYSAISYTFTFYPFFYRLKN